MTLTTGATVSSLASNGRGGGLYVQRSTTVTLTGKAIAGNVASAVGDIAISGASTGTLTANTTLTFTFAVTHTLNYGQSATNVVSYTQSTRQGTSAATFYVWRQVYLPLVLK